MNKRRRATAIPGLFVAAMGLLLAWPALRAWAADPQTSLAVYLPMLNRDAIPNYQAPFGVVLYENVDDVNGLMATHTAGSRWVTTFLYWAAIEPNAPVGGVHTYDWSSFDAKVNNAQAAGIELFVLFTGNPGWAAQYPGGPVNNIQDLKDFVGAMVARYPDVHYWSFYAEPDNGDVTYAEQGKGYWGNNGAGYAAMLAEIAPVVHAANPNAKALIGGLAYNWFTSEGGIFVKSFLGDVLQALNANHGGAARYIDAVAFHYYSTRPNSIAATTQEIRAILSQHGVGSLPLLVPETGVASGTDASGQLEQARWLVRTYIQGFAAGLRLVSWFSVLDSQGPVNENLGLFQGSNLSQPKLAYTAYQVMTAELMPSVYVGPLNAPGAEGYRFLMANGQTKTVVWGNGADASVSFGLACLRVTDLLGGQIGAGGVLTVSAGHPVYVTACP